MTSTKKVKAHTIYKTSEGNRVPGVTTILGILNKPALIKWANKMGLQGIDTTNYVNEKADIGTCCHEMIECDLKELEFEGYEYSQFVLEQAETGYLKWLEWKNGKDISIIGSEMVLVSDEHRFGGTCGVRTLIDIKTSASGIYPEMKHQTAGGYRILLEENGYPVEQVIILRISCDAGEGYEELMVGNWELHERLFLLCRELYDLQKVAE